MARRDSINLHLVKYAMNLIEDMITGYPFQDNTGRDILQLGDERELLYSRIILNKTMEQTAEYLSVSRDTAYRLSRTIKANNNIPQGILIEYLKIKEKLKYVL